MSIGAKSKKENELYFVVFDLGTTNLKIALFHRAKLLAWDRVGIAGFIKGGRIQASPLQEVFFQKLKKIWQEAGKPPLRAIGGVGIMHGLVIFDPQEDCFEECITYSNLEAADEAEKLRNISRRVYLRRGSPPSSAYGPEQAALRSKKKKDLFYPSTAILLAPMAGETLSITKPALSHLGFLNLKTLEFDSLMLEFCQASEDNFADVSSDFVVGRLDPQFCRDYDFSCRGNEETLLMDLGGDGLIVHELIDQFSIGSYKVESTAVVRVEVAKPVLEEIENGQIPVTWNYLHEPGRFIWGAATSAGVLTLKDYLPAGLDYQNLDQKLDKALKAQGIPSLSKVGIGLPFSRGERAPGWSGKRSHGIRGKKPEKFLWQYYLWKEAVAFNMRQVVSKMKQVARRQKLEFPEKFLMSGVINYSEVWAKLQALICQVNLIQSKVEEPGLLAGANRILKFFGKKTIPLQKGRVYRPNKIDYPFLSNLSKRHQFYLQKYQQA